jgi:hypothetical protein
MAATLFFPAPLMAQQQGFLENPTDFSNESGIGVVSGFHCNAQIIEVIFDEYDPIEAASGTSRLDAESYCGGNSNTGYALLWNWNILGPGQHTVRVLADGVEFDSSTITVHTFGEEFVYGINTQTDLIVLDQEKNVYIRWQEPKQNFGIVGIEPSDLTQELLMEAVMGDWSGTWYSTTGSGSINMTFVESAYGTPRLENFQLTGTGCAEGGFSDGAPFDINNPVFEILMSDGSEMEVELSATESVSMLGGDFYFDSGPCEAAEGMYYMFRN